MRGAVQTVGALATVVGAVTWVAGWRYGHLLTTTGLATLVVAYWPSNFSLHRAIAVAHAEHTERSTGDETEVHLERAVHHLRKLTAKSPDDTWHLAMALDQQWKLLVEQERYDDALPIAREAVETWTGPATRTRVGATSCAIRSTMSLSTSAVWTGGPRRFHTPRRPSRSSDL